VVKVGEGMIVIVDYGMGNLRSVEKGFLRVGYSAMVSSSAKDIENAKGIVLPGVGAFGDCIRNLEKLGLIEVIKEGIYGGKWFLGICLGYQVLFEESEEFVRTRGMGIFKGRVKRFEAEMRDEEGGFLKVPHIGWNQVEVVKAHPIFEGIESGDYFYFVHSYYVEPMDKELILTTTDYGVRFASGIASKNVIAFQFHPEKSQSKGLVLLKNFAKLVYDKG